MKKLLMLVLLLGIGLSSVEAQTVKIKKDELLIDNNVVFNIKKKVTSTGFPNVVYEVPGRGPIIMATNHADPNRKPITTPQGTQVDPTYYTLEFVEVEGKKVEIDAVGFTYPVKKIIEDLLLYGVIDAKGDVNVNMLDKYISSKGGCCKFSDVQNPTIIINNNK